ncbi:hypothetical protein SPKIRA_36980 (plasmid) [Sphingomonas paucimobilis]|uniref:hypothetical protein n=1 Tax=Sphingomonas paucimobilis TaxID=13689 RepID=UPI0015DD0505|nr:hypothetical protein [Sphingomonas paucimobilis]BCI72868.1 hypothetical protein SPKIRA_36980 [Sphingomonas paucimobilis]
MKKAMPRPRCAGIMVRTIRPIAAGPIAACARPISIRAAISASTDPAHPQASVARLDPSNARASSRASGQRRAAMIIGITASPLISAKAGLDKADRTVTQMQRGLDRLDQDRQQETVAHRQHMDQRHQQRDAIAFAWRRSGQIRFRPVVSVLPWRDPVARRR